MRTKIIAFYLPQFHAIPENDEWWGKGFTDWTNVRKARPLYASHRQPRVPLEGYYDLSDVEVMRRQAELANEYGVSGFCFYHYWFDGKLLLERPAEQLLQHPDIDMPFCFSWANEPWARTWDGKASQVLMPQAYGTEADWRQHFEYLLPFFRDPRYMCVDGAPIFLIYKSRSIPECKAMMELWIAMAKDAGLPGIHFVQTIRENELDSRPLPFAANAEFEPARSIRLQGSRVLTWQRIRRAFLRTVNKVFRCQIHTNPIIPFRRMTTLSLNHNSPVGTYGGVFAGWDNTARRSTDATIIQSPSREEFADFLRAKIRQTHDVYKTDCIFINAWNEWAEGTYLEPDTDNRYMYLEAIRDVLSEQR